MTSGLPQVGDVYMVHTVVFTNGDHAEVRPCVVVRAPRDDLDYIVFIQRSTTAGTKVGVDHPSGQIPELDRDGRWVLQYCRTERCDRFLASASRKVGTLDATYLTPLIDLWEAQ